MTPHTMSARKVARSRARVRNRQIHMFMRSSLRLRLFSRMHPRVCAELRIGFYDRLLISKPKRRGLPHVTLVRMEDPS